MQAGWPFVCAFHSGPLEQLSKFPDQIPGCIVFTWRARIQSKAKFISLGRVQYERQGFFPGNKAAAATEVAGKRSYSGGKRFRSVINGRAGHVFCFPNT